MKPFVTLLSAIAIFLAHALPAGAAITIIRDYHLGEADPGVTVGLPATVCVDSARSNNLTMTGAPVYSADTVTPSISFISLQFNGTNYGVASFVTNLTDNFCIEAWVKTPTDSATNYIFYNGSTAHNGCGIFQNGSNFEVHLGDSAVFGSAPVQTNVWTHLALVRNNGTTSLYINGLPAGSSLWPCYTPDNAFAIATAPDNPGSNGWVGLIDEVRVFGFAPGAFQKSDLLLDRPVLNISPQAGLMLVTWPTNRAVQYGLEASTNFLDWTPLSAFPVNDLFTSSNSVTDGNWFFRLNDTQRCFNTNTPIQLQLTMWQDYGFPASFALTNTYTSYYVGYLEPEEFYTVDTTPQALDNTVYKYHIAATIIGDATNCFSDYTYSWVINDIVNPSYGTQAITGYYTPELTIGEDSLPGDAGIEVDLFLTVTRLADGRQDTFYFPTAPSGGSQAAAYISTCQIEGNCDDSNVDPTSEPRQTY